ncbi:MAG: hypothetical protein AVDCRST_MAG79-418, partial [uncultured Thermoleophilia bacterium]
GHHRLHHPRPDRRRHRQGDHAGRRPGWHPRHHAHRRGGGPARRLPRLRDLRRRPDGRVLRHLDVADRHHRRAAPAVHRPAGHGPRASRDRL